MAIEIKEDHIGRGGTNAGALDNSDTRSWWVKTDDRLYGKAQVESAGWSSGDFPRPLIDSYPGQPGMLCKSLETTQVDDKGPFLWRVTARYDTKPIGKEQRDREQFPNPIDRPAVYSGGFERDRKVIDKDLDGKAIINSAKDTFQDPVTAPRTRLRIRGRKHVPVDAIPDWFFDLKDKTNSGSLVRGGRTFREKTLLFIPGEIGEPQIENDVEYRTIHWELEYREETWVEKRENKGFNQLVLNPDTGDYDLKIPIEIDGAPTALAQFLDLNGTLLTIQQLRDDNLVTMEFNTVETADFGPIP